MLIEKDGIKYNIKNEIQLTAFLNSGWRKIEPEDTEPLESPMNLYGLTKEQLLELAKQRGLDISHVKTKEQIVSLLKNA